MISDETLEDPVLRQAYDHFGHSAAELVRHNRYSHNSLYRNLSKLHDEGKPSEALEVLHIVLEDKKQERREKEWEWNADVQVNMHACTSQVGSMEWPEVSSTNVSLVASVPMPPQTAPSPFPTQSSSGDRGREEQRMQLSIGGSSSLENGIGSTQGLLSATYHPVPTTSVTSDLAVGRNVEASISSATQLSNGTSLSAKVARQYELGSEEGGNLAFAFTSQRSLSLIRGRSVHSMFALGAGSDFAMQYGVLSFTTWGFGTAAEEESDRPLPRLSAKMTIGSPFPFECSVQQSHLFDVPHRSGKASVAWSPTQGYKLKGMLSRSIARRCNYHASKFASTFSIGVEHTGMSGLKWLIRYERPEGLTITVPIFVASFLSPVYWQRVIWVSTMSFLLDETIEELMGSTPSDLEKRDSDALNSHKTTSIKIHTNEKEQQWLNSSKAREEAERQLAIIAPVSKMKRRREESTNGLVIMKATYVSEFSSSEGASPSIKSLDVTHQLQFWVNGSRLYLPPKSKSVLLGFYELHSGCSKMPDLNRDGGGGDHLALYNVAHRLVCLMNSWLSLLGIGGEDAPDDESNNDGATIKGSTVDSTVTLTVRYKYNGCVYDISVRDCDALELPSSAAMKLGSSNLVS